MARERHCESGVRFLLTSFFFLVPGARRTRQAIYNSMQTVCTGPRASHRDRNGTWMRHGTSALVGDAKEGDVIGRGGISGRHKTRWEGEGQHQMKAVKDKATKKGKGRKERRKE